MQASISDLSYFFYRLNSLINIIWGTLSNSLANSINTQFMFASCEKIESINFSPLNTRYFFNTFNMFNRCSNLKSIDWGNIKVRSADMGAMFYSCQSIESIDASFLDPEYNETRNMNSMFYGCSALKTVDLSNLKTVAVTNANSAFYSCRMLTNVVFEYNCFSNSSFSSLDLSYSPLSHDCAVDIFNKLAARTNSPTLKLSSTTKGYLTENEIAIATGKGWVVS